MSTVDRPRVAALPATTAPSPTAPATTPEFRDTYAGGARIEFHGGALDTRPVRINGRIELTLQRGAPPHSFTAEGLRIDVNGADLAINGKRVDFTNQSANRSKDELVARFPGVQFYGEPQGAVIGEHVKIEAGAIVELSPNLRLEGHTEIKAGARISGGEIVDSQVGGWVSGGRVFGSLIEAGALVQGGELASSTLQTGARVYGGGVYRSWLEHGATVSGNSRLDQMRMKAGSVVSGGDLRNFELAAGQQVQGGTHHGGQQLSPMLQMAATMFMPQLMFMPGSQQMLNHAAQGFQQLAGQFMGPGRR